MMAPPKNYNASGGDIFSQKKRGRDFAAPPIGETLTCASPGTVIGVPACTVTRKCHIMVNKSLHLLAKNIPAGGINLLTLGPYHA
ncbi:hypothetical protein MNBD_ALPHA07-1694 [hydrothermal vent metagenome]|uniref:Uncharacterized protein n=1 Tax=hydrothermal vent metagenome TaxID=652676 RepID=A0A3B0RVH8_9ZZZZ